MTSENSEQNKDGKKTEGKKTKAKRMGVKSVLVHGSKELAITSFGQGNAAEIAVRTDAAGSNLPRLATSGRFKAKSVSRQGIEAVGSSAGETLESLLHNPAEDARSDYLDLKGTLEKEFFGREFPTDNIRIQIIHQILDIQKLLGIYVADIIYTINNLRDDVHLDEKSDIVGLAMNDDVELKINLGKMLPYLGMFGDAFELPPRPKKHKNGNVAEQVETPADIHNKSVLRILGTLRQATAHYREAALPFRGSGELPKKFRKNSEKAKWDAWQTIERHYAKLVERINKDFITNSALNIQLLYKLLKPIDEAEKKQIVEEYYCFSILKDGKNLGVNLRTVREAMFKNRFYEVRSKDHDTYRSKFYGIVDFLLFREYATHSAKTTTWVKKLQESKNQEEKEKLYVGFGENAGMILGAKVESLLGTLSGYFSPKNKDLKKASELSDFSQTYQSYIDDVRLTTEADPLVKLLAFLCNFWEGKEINELLSAYIHKFENIQEFLDTIKKLEKPEENQEDGPSEKQKKTEPLFTEKYALFDEPGRDKDGKLLHARRAGEIAQNLRVLASIGKMKPDLDGAKRQLYKAAIEMLGVPDDSKYVTDDWLAENVLLDRSDKGAYDKRRKDVNPFRNFIAGNVISSRRFMYLVRYTKPRTVRALMSNRVIVRFVLSRIADIQDVHMTESQIDRYYQNLPCYREGVQVDRDTKIDALADYLVKYSFEKDVCAQKKGIVLNTQSPEKNVEIERLKALTGLYLSVAYIAVKNLVKANAMYYIAFACFDRDLALMRKKWKDDPERSGVFAPINTGHKNKEGKDIMADPYWAITEHFLDEDEKLRYVWDPDKSVEENKKACYAHLDAPENRRHFTKKWQEILRRNIAEAKKISETGWLLTTARNQAEHLNVLTALPGYVAEFRGDERPNGPRPRNLYFQLYHYLLQRLLFEDEQLRGPLAEYAEKVKQYGTPSSDLVNILYISLGYNLPRYKNLTVEALFEKLAENKTGQDKQSDPPPRQTPQSQKPKLNARERRQQRKGGGD